MSEANRFLLDGRACGGTRWRHGQAGGWRMIETPRQRGRAQVRTEPAAKVPQLPHSGGSVLAPARCTYDVNSRNLNELSADETSVTILIQSSGSMFSALP